MKSIAFPKMISLGHVQTVSDLDATYEDLRLLIGSEKGSFTFDPFFGVMLKRYMFEQNNVILRDILLDEIYEQIVIFMPNLIITKKDIKLTSDREKVYCNIRARNRKDFQLNTYNLVLFNTQE